MTNQEVHETLIMWLIQLWDNLTVIKSHQSAKRPELPYCMVDLVNFSELEERPSSIKYEEKNGNVEETPQIEIEWNFLIFCYGENCEELMRRLLSSFHSAQNQEPFFPQLSIHEIGTVNSIPELIGERWEPRAQVNLALRGISSDGFVIDTIEEHTPFEITRERT